MDCLHFSITSSFSESRNFIDFFELYAAGVAYSFLMVGNTVFPFDDSFLTD
jgi:hypothetical protein